MELQKYKPWTEVQKVNIINHLLTPITYKQLTNYLEHEWHIGHRVRYIYEILFTNMYISNIFSNQQNGVSTHPYFRNFSPQTQKNKDKIKEKNLPWSGIAVTMSWQLWKLLLCLYKKNEIVRAMSTECNLQTKKEKSNGVYNKY